MAAPPPASKFGAYRLVTRLGRGGMGEAWRAVREGPQGISKEVVIKRILRAYSENPAFKENFIQEARLSARLSHGNIAQVFDFGEVNGEYFMALEYVHGSPLSRVIERAREKGLRGLPVPVAVYVAIEMLKGLSHAHTRTDESGHPLQIVHRDISPDNVMVSFEGEVKLVDFGIAKAALQGRSETEPGLVKGKVPYFSPEQATGEALDARSDLWSVGLVLYELLAGRAPVEGAQHVVLIKLSRGEIPPIRARAPWVPEALADLVHEALKFDREDRYPNALAFQEALATWLHRAEPELSHSALTGTMVWLFEDRLAGEGQAAVVSASVKRLIQESAAATTETVRAVGPARTVKVLATPVHTDAATVLKPPRPEAGSPLPWVVGGVCLVAVGVAAGVLLREEPPGAGPGVGAQQQPVKLLPPEPLVVKATIVSARPEVDAGPAPELEPADAGAARAAEAVDAGAVELAVRPPQPGPRPVGGGSSTDPTQLGLAAYEKGRWKQAGELFERALAAGDDSWETALRLGVANVRRGEWKDGRIQVNEALRRAGKSGPPDLRADGAYAMALAAEGLGMRTEAFGRLRQCFKLATDPQGRLKEVGRAPEFARLRATSEYQDLFVYVDRLDARRQ